MELNIGISRLKQNCINVIHISFQKHGTKSNNKPKYLTLTIRINSNCADKQQIT